MTLLTVHLAPGCGPSEEPPPLADVSTPGHLTPDAGCLFTVQADAVLAPVVALAAEHWSAATSCEIMLGDSGPLFEIAESIERPDGTQAPGVTNAARTHVQIHARTRPEARFSAVMHELGHVLGGEHTDTMAVLSMHKGHSAVIDLAALETVCLKLACGTLSPEEP